jgi:predicted GNAT family acetyltransferase
MSHGDAEGQGNAGGPATEVVVEDVPDASRYEARVRTRDGVVLDGVGVTEYVRHGTTIVLAHTEVPESLSGRGVGTALAVYALDDARRRGLAVVPRCPFIASFIRRHREYRDLVPARMWKALELDGEGAADGRRTPKDA